MAFHLAIEASKNTVDFTVLKEERVRERHIVSLKATNDQERKTELGNQFSSLPISKQDFDDITLSWSNEKSTIIPNFVLNDSDPTSVFNLCFGGNEDSSSVDYNRVAELGVINVYEIPDWIKSFFVIKFPTISIQHTGSHAIRKVMHENAFYLKANVILFNGYFLLSLVKHNKLEFYSFFDYLSAEDVIYHLTFALQQKEMISEKGSIEIIAGIDSDKKMQLEIEKLKSKVEDLNKLELKVVEDFIAKSQLLCV